MIFILALLFMYINIKEEVHVGVQCNQGYYRSLLPYIDDAALKAVGTAGQVHYIANG